MEERHPYSLIGIDGNAFSIIGYVANAMKQCGYSRDAITVYKSEALSGDYNNLLSVSIKMIDNCNILSGYDDPMQQMMKGHDDLDYVDYPYTGTQNRTEKLIDENYHINEDIDWSELDDDDPPLTDTFYNRDNENKQVKLSKDYQELYNTILNKLVLVLETEIDIKNIFTKKMVENALIGPDGIINDTTFWEDLEDQVEYEIPMYLYESTSMMDIYIKNKIKSRLYNTLAQLLDNECKFSKYDIYHVFIQILSSGALYDRLSIYIKEDE